MCCTRRFRVRVCSRGVQKGAAIWGIEKFALGKILGWFLKTVSSSLFSSKLTRKPGDNEGFWIDGRQDPSLNWRPIWMGAFERTFKADRPDRCVTNSEDSVDLVRGWSDTRLRNSRASDQVPLKSYDRELDLALNPVLAVESIAHPERRCHRHMRGGTVRQLGESRNHFGQKLRRNRGQSEISLSNFAFKTLISF
jgi:hypothetical protein